MLSIAQWIDDWLSFIKKLLFWKCLVKFEFINMPITKPSLIHRGNFTLAGAHDSALIITLTLGTSLFMYNKNQSLHGSSYFIQTCGHVTDVKTRQSSCVFQLNNKNYVKN